MSAMKNQNFAPKRSTSREHSLLFEIFQLKAIEMIKK